MDTKCYICGIREAKKSVLFKGSPMEISIKEPTCGEEECLRQYDLFITESLDYYEFNNKDIFMEDISYEQSR